MVTLLTPANLAIFRLETPASMASMTSCRFGRLSITEDILCPIMCPPSPPRQEICSLGLIAAVWAVGSCRSFALLFYARACKEKEYGNGTYPYMPYRIPSSDGL